MNMKLNKHLAKYKKRWTKQRSVDPIGPEEGGIFLMFNDVDPMIHHRQYKTIALQQFPSNQIPVRGLYFFELFKYIKKFKQYDGEVHIIAIRTTTGRHAIDPTPESMRREIKKHLLAKYNQKINGKIGTRMLNLKEHEKVIDHCFDLAKNKGVEISLVIQKKIGYKYYENIKYY